MWHWLLLVVDVLMLGAMAWSATRIKWTRRTVLGLLSGIPAGMVIGLLVRFVGEWTLFVCAPIYVIAAVIYTMPLETKKNDD